MSHPPMNNDPFVRVIRTGADVDMDELELRISRMVHGAVAEAVSEAVREHALPPETREWISRAMKSQAERDERRSRLYGALIEKGWTALIFGAIASVFYLVVEWAKQHGYKP